MHRARLAGGRTSPASSTFFGDRLTSCQVADLAVVELRHEAGLRIPRHEHERAYLSLILAGTFTESCGRRRTRFSEPGMLLLHPVGEVHWEQMNRVAVSSLNIELGSSWLRELLEIGAPLDRSFDVRDERIALAGARLVSECRREDRDSALAVESLTWEILHASMRLEPSAPERTPPRWLRDLRDLIDGSVGAPPPLCSIAKAAGVHPVYFAAVFRRFHGCSLGEYYRRRRLEAARARLADPDLPLARVAFEVGFADQSHFTRTFRRYTGMSPGQYRTFLGFKTS
jgi:AraC family transcriptional regulator